MLPTVRGYIETAVKPGFTAVSMYPRLRQASGLTYAALIDRLVQLALERHADKKKSKTNYNRV